MSTERARTLLEDHEYPTTASSLAGAVGDVRLDHPGGEERLDAVLERLGETTFESPREAYHGVCSVVSCAAVGRVGYSDRDSMPIGTGGSPVSF